MFGLYNQYVQTNYFWDPEDFRVRKGEFHRNILIFSINWPFFIIQVETSETKSYIWMLNNNFIYLNVSFFFVIYTVY